MNRAFRPDSHEPSGAAALTDRVARARILSVGGLLAAFAAASCCVVPFALFTIGVSGAWIGNLTALEPFQPLFAALAFSLLGYGFHLVYRAPRAACAEEAYCANPRSHRIAKIGLWTAAVLVLVALGFPKLAPLFL